MWWLDGLIREATVDRQTLTLAAVLAGAPLDDVDLPTVDEVRAAFADYLDPKPRPVRALTPEETRMAELKKALGLRVA